MEIECYSFLSTLEKFQSAITGLVGFSGVIITLIVNARISRKRVEEARLHDKKILAEALKGELNTYLNSVQSNVKDIASNRDRGNELLFPRISTAIFDANITKLGHLPEGAMSSILDAFLSLKELDRSLTIFSTVSNDFYHHIPAQSIDGLLKMLQSLVPKIESAVRSLSH